MTAAYIAAPVGAEGVDVTGAQVVPGPELGNFLSRVELAVQIFELLVERGQLSIEREELLVELDILRKRLVVAQAATKHMDRLRGRMETECGLRVRYQRRLDGVAEGLAIIAAVHPQVRGTVELVRNAIFGIEEGTGV